MTVVQTWAIQSCSKRGEDGDWTKYTSLGRFPPRHPVCFALSAQGTSHAPTRGQIPGLFYSDGQTDGRRRNSMTFARNSRAIIFESRPLAPRCHTLIIGATADGVPLATYWCLQSAAKHFRDEPTHAGLHTGVSRIIKYRRKRGRGSGPTQYRGKLSLQTTKIIEIKKKKIRPLVWPLYLERMLFIYVQSGRKFQSSTTKLFYSKWECLGTLRKCVELQNISQINHEKPLNKIPSICSIVVKYVSDGSSE